MGALSGIKILDIAPFAVVTWGTMMLADLGAEVIGIELPRGERKAHWEMLDDDTHNHWLAYKRNRKSMTLNLKTDEGKKIFYKLAEKADAIMEGQRPGAAKRLGIDYDTVKKVNPEIVYCSVSGFGQDGPYVQLLGHEPNYQALSGILHETGNRGAPPTFCAPLVGDLWAGAMHATVATLSALIYKMKTGKGQFIDVSILAGALNILSRRVYVYWEQGALPRGEYDNPGGHPALDVYETKDKRYIVTSAVEPWSWAKMCKILNLPKLAQFNYPSATIERRDQVRAALRKTFASKTRDEWEQLNNEHDLGISPVKSISEVLEDPQIKHLNMVVEIDYPTLGKIKQLGIPFRLSETPGEVKFMPRYGEHTEDILAELGFTKSDVTQLRDKRVIE